MKRDIELYIGNKRVDLDGDVHILYNYTLEDLNNPTIVKNTFSQQVTLKGTATNNKIFGGIFRIDRRTLLSSTPDWKNAGLYFDASCRTPFEIYNAMGEILESGYCKLDNVVTKGGDIKYQISLYGGLGAFLYSLAYDEAQQESTSEEDSKKTLASLLFKNRYGNALDMDFKITKSAILEAWERLNGENDKELWDVINFAPCNNGIPDDFGADKALVKTANSTDFPTSHDGVQAVHGYALVDLAREFYEWEMKDLRSYLQRPVLSVKRFFDAICDPENNGGYTVVLDDTFFNLHNPYFADAWMTLPKLTDLDLEGSAGVQDFDDMLITNTSPTVEKLSSDIILEDGAVRKSSFSAKVRPALDFGATVVEGQQLGTTWISHDFRTSIRQRGLLVQLVGYDAAGNIIAASPTGLFISQLEGEPEQYTPSEFASRLDSGAFSPLGDAGFMEEAVFGKFIAGTDESGLLPRCYTWTGQDMLLEMTGDGITKVVLRAAWGSITAVPDTHDSDWAQLYTAYEDGNIVNTGDGNLIVEDIRNDWESLDGVRSGTLIPKDRLLATESTPADFLLSYCKQFGLLFVADPGRKQVSIMTKNTFYRNEVIDLTERVDKGQEITSVPFAFDSKWYDFVNEVSGGLAEKYTDKYKRPFGLQRINTGYSFSAERKNVMENVLFKGGVEALEKNVLYCTLLTGNTRHFNWQIFPYTVNYGSGDNTASFDSRIVPTDKRFWNLYHPKYDTFPKVQFCDEDGKSTDGEFVLLFLNKENPYSYEEHYALSDDSADMLFLNDGEACWYACQEWNDDLTIVDSKIIPQFSRYLRSAAGGFYLTRSWDFGTPKEIYNPTFTNIMANRTLYEQFWKTYIADRYNIDSRVVTVKVRLSGLTVGMEALRKFYYFENTIWALNSISNYDYTQEGMTECEFVRVKRQDSYTDGMKIPVLAWPLNPKIVIDSSEHEGANRVPITIGSNFEITHMSPETDDNWIRVRSYEVDLPNKTLKIGIDEKQTPGTRVGYLNIFVSPGGGVPSQNVRVRIEQGGYVEEL